MTRDKKKKNRGGVSNLVQSYIYNWISKIKSNQSSQKNNNIGNHVFLSNVSLNI